MSPPRPVSARSAGRGIERHLSPRERPRIDPAEHQISVGDGRALAAPAVAGRTGIGPGALRSDPEAARLAVGDGATPGADGVDIDDRHHQGKAFEVSFGGDIGRAIDDEANVKARPAHVDADQVRATQNAGQGDPTHRAADRT